MTFTYLSLQICYFHRLILFGCEYICDPLLFDISTIAYFLVCLGAYYYYNTEPNKTYEETMLDIKIYADALNIPYK